MRTITSDDGQTWDVAIHQASYGMHYLLFAARGSDEMRQSLIGASTQIEAERELVELTDDDLKSLLMELDPVDPTAA